MHDTRPHQGYYIAAVSPRRLFICCLCDAAPSSASHGARIVRRGGAVGGVFSASLGAEDAIGSAGIKG